MSEAPQNLLSSEYLDQHPQTRKRLQDVVDKYWGSLREAFGDKAADDIKKALREAFSYAELNVTLDVSKKRQIPTRDVPAYLASPEPTEEKWIEGIRAQYLLQRFRDGLRIALTQRKDTVVQPDDVPEGGNPVRSKFQRRVDEGARPLAIDTSAADVTGMRRSANKPRRNRR